MIREEILTPVVADCDVLVCGGGFGGISGALAAARQGAKVMLLEKEYILGGLGTAGLVTIYLPLCDGMGHQVSFGIAEELFRLSVSMGAESGYPDNWLSSDDPTRRTEHDPRFKVRYNPHLFAMLAEKLLVEAGVRILYGAYAVAVSKKGDKIDAVVVENKSGRQAIRVKSVVDATGDCDIAHFANAPTSVNPAGNSLAAWYYFLNENGYNLKMLGFLDVPDSNVTENEKVKLSQDRDFDGLDGFDLSSMVQTSHAATLQDIQRLRETDPSIVPTCLATIPQVRMTRKLVGAYSLDVSQMHTYFADSVGMVSDWRKRGPVYEVPFGTLYCKEVPNLITAGRCASVTDAMWDIMRVIPCCAVTGQAAGTAAAMTDDFSALDIKQLQEKLVQSGVVLHENDL